MGSGLVYHLGQLEYVDSSSSSASLSTSLLVYLSGAVGGVIMVTVLIIIILFVRKSRQSARAVKHMRTQMDVLEARVAKECKEGKKNAKLTFIFMRPSLLQRRWRRYIFSVLVRVSLCVPPESLWTYMWYKLFGINSPNFVWD